MTSADDVRSDPGPSKLWWVACGLLCMTILTYGLLGYKDDQGSWAANAGHSFAFAVAIAAIFHIAFGRRESESTSWLGFLFIFLSLFVASHLSGLRHNGGIRGVVADATLSAVQATPPNGEGAALASNPFKPSRQSDDEIIDAVLQKLRTRLVAQLRDYRLELNAIGWAGILDGERLEGDLNLVESRVILKQALTISENYRLRAMGVFEVVRQEVYRPEPTASRPRSIPAELDGVLEKMESVIQEFWTIEVASINEVSKIIDLLSERRDAWWAVEERIVFQNQSDYDRYKFHMNEFYSLGTRQRELLSPAAKPSAEVSNQPTR